MCKTELMSENVDNLILEHLCAMRSDLAGIRDDVRDVKGRLTSIEGAVAALRRDHIGALHVLMP